MVLKFRDENYKIEQIIPCNGNWVIVDGSKEYYIYHIIIAWALVIHLKEPEEPEEYQDVIPLINEDIGTLVFGQGQQICLSDEAYQFVLKSPFGYSRTQIPTGELINSDQSLPNLNEVRDQLYDLIELITNGENYDEHYAKAKSLIELFKQENREIKDAYWSEKITDVERYFNDLRINNGKSPRKDSSTPIGALSRIIHKNGGLQKDTPYKVSRQV